MLVSSSSSLFIFHDDVFRQHFWEWQIPIQINIIQNNIVLWNILHAYIQLKNDDSRKQFVVFILKQSKCVFMQIQEHHAEFTHTTTTLMPHQSIIITTQDDLIGC